MSHCCVVRFREDKLTFWNNDFEIWLRYLILHYPGKSCSGDKISKVDERLFQQLLFMSHHSDCGGGDFTYLDEDLGAIIHLLQAAAYLEETFSRIGIKIPAEALSLMNFSLYSGFREGKKVSEVLSAGDEFVSLFTKNRDLIEGIYQRYENERRKGKGRKCDQCGFPTFGDVCFDCGLSWSDDPKLKEVSKRPPLCSIDSYINGGNPFDHRGFIKRVEQ